MINCCSACGRRLRFKRVTGGVGGNLQSGSASTYTDWLNHRRDCPRYGLPPDTTRALS